jgi:hypothetical protein
MAPIRKTWTRILLTSQLSNYRILTGGFKIGGVGGHPQAHGASLVIILTSPSSDE